MANIVVNDIASQVTVNVIDTLTAATIGGEKIFGAVSVVDNPKSFIETADVLKSAPLPDVGIVEGTIDEQNGTSDYETSICRLPLDILVRFKFVRKPGDTERTAIERMKFLTEAVKVALLADKSRGGLCNLVQWGGTAINGTSVNGTARALSAVANEAFFTAAVSVVCVWSKFDTFAVIPPIDFGSMTDEQFANLQ